MRLNIAEHFRVLDERKVEDPWGIGFSLTIRRIGYRPYQEAVKKRQKKNPVFQQIAEAGMKAAVKALAKGQKGDDDKKAVHQEVFEHALEDAADRLDLGDFDLDDLSPIDDTALLVAGWDGVTDLDKGGVGGVAVECSVDNVVEFFSIDTPLIPPDEDGEGGHAYGEHGTLGRAIQAWVLTEAANTEAFREQRKEEAAKNSPSSPAGALASGRT